MEILQFLLSFLFNQFSNGKLEPIFNLLKQNSFDVKNALANLDVNTLGSIFNEFSFNDKSTSSPNFNEEVHKLKPIESLADRKIVNALNGYFESV